MHDSLYNLKFSGMHTFIMAFFLTGLVGIPKMLPSFGSRYWSTSNTGLIVTYIVITKSYLTFRLFQLLSLIQKELVWHGKT